MSSGFLVKIIPPEGYSVYRLHFTPQHVVALGILIFGVLASAVGIHAYQLHAASANIALLEGQRKEQQRTIEVLVRQTQALQNQNAQSEKAIQAIDRALGTGVKSTSPPLAKHAFLIPAAPGSATALLARLRMLQIASARTQAEAERLKNLASRVLNMRRVAAITRERLIAAIPSLNPVNGAIASVFGYRSTPWPEFHHGLDLAADYGTVVHATAAGTVVSSGWDGGFGIKVDIDHGNGYHTWYCHLSRSAVTPGERVTKGEAIAAVGSTGASTGPHLHYQMMHGGVAIDPTRFLNGVPADAIASLPADSSVH